MSVKKIPTLFTKEEDCCGCAACKDVCPVNAIVMTFDKKGYYYPEIDEEKCIGCLSCLKVCAFKN